MSIIISLFRELPFLIMPSELLGWSGLFVLSAALVFVLYRYRNLQKPWNKVSSILFISLVIAVPITSLFLGVQLSDWNSQPLPGGLLEPQSLFIMLFSAIPWVLAAGLLGPLPATILAIGSGIILAFWNTHSPFTIFEIASQAVIVSIFSLQRYRQVFHAALRQPFIAALLASLIYPLIFLVNSIYLTGGDFYIRLDFASTNVIPFSIAVGLPLWIAGLVAQLVNYAFPTAWGGRAPWKPSPSEGSILLRSARNIVPVITAILCLFVVFGWKIAQKESEKLLVNRMSNVASITAESIPHFLDTGQSLILEIADTISVTSASPSEMKAVLEEQIQTVPYFSQLFVIDNQGNPKGGFPDEKFDSKSILLDELIGIDLAFNGFQNQLYLLPPIDEEESVQLSFIAAIKNELGIVNGVLVGRTKLQTNPFAQVILNNLSSIEDVGGTGFLLDETNRIIYHPNHDRLLENYPIELANRRGFLEVSDPGGTRQMIFSQPIEGRSWSVVMTTPVSESRKMALIQILPFIGIVILSSAITLLLLLLSLRNITSSIKTLAIETDRIADGNLGHNMPSAGVDEVGQLSTSLEQMRVGLKARFDEFRRLLTISQGIVTSTTLEDALRPILEMGISMGASSARILMSPIAELDTTSESKVHSRFGLGRLTHIYQDLDDQILELMSHQDRMVLPNASRTTLMNIKKGTVFPGSLMAVVLRHENQYFGVFWIAYSQEHIFNREEVRFISTLAEQATLAVLSNRSFWSTEFDRQRLIAILESIPDPIVVADHEDQLLMANSIAQKVFGIDPEVNLGETIKEIFKEPDLINFIQTTDSQEDSKEIVFPDGKTYLATASSILVDEASIGRLCYFHDITQFKELDALKSVFVATVSHDLRSSLTLLRGYTTMLTTVGELNKQQESYVRKLMNSVDSMSRLINNLLDLGRMETDIGLRLQTLPVHDIFEEVIDNLQMKANQKKVKIHFEPEKLFLPLIEADHAMLYQAFLNLLDNAIKFSPDGKDVWIRIKTIDDKIIFSFEDQGIGISAIDKPRLFEKFFRSAQKDARSESGSGLGLAIVKSVAEHHGGRVWVESQLGKGSTFYFEIPIRQQK